MDPQVVGQVLLGERQELLVSEYVQVHPRGEQGVVLRGPPKEVLAGPYPRFLALHLVLRAEEAEDVLAYAHHRGGGGNGVEGRLMLA